MNTHRIPHTDLTEFASMVCGFGRFALSQDEPRVPKTPLDLAAEVAKSLIPGRSWIFYRGWVQSINRMGAWTPTERRILSTYRNAMERYRLTGRAE